MPEKSGVCTTGPLGAEWRHSCWERHRADSAFEQRHGLDDLEVPPEDIFHNWELYMPSGHPDLERFTIEKKYEKQPVIIPDSDAAFVRGEASSDSTEETEAFRG